MADVNMNYDNGMTLEIMKQLYPSSSSLVLGYPDVDSAKAAANIPQPGSGQNLIIFNTNKPPK